MAKKKTLIKILRKQTELTDRLLTIVDCMAEDVGCTDHPDKIWPVLGPVNDKARDILRKIDGADHG